MSGHSLLKASILALVTALLFVFISEELIFSGLESERDSLIAPSKLEKLPVSFFNVCTKSIIEKKFITDCLRFYNHDRGWYILARSQNRSTSHSEAVASEC